MGYTIKTNIANVTDPQPVSLSDTPSYVEIKRLKDAIGGLTVRITLNVESTDLEITPELTEPDDIQNEVAQKTEIIFIEEISKAKHIIKGTTDPARVNSGTYFVQTGDTSTTAQNIKDCLMKNSFLSSNFHIQNAIAQGENNTVSIDNKIKLESIGKGSNYKISFPSAPCTGKMINKIVKLTQFTSTSNDDSIDNGSGKASMELEVYTNTGSQLGEIKFPEDSLGTYMTTLSKSYHGEPLWFNINALMSNKSTFSDEFLTATGWCNAGTVTDYRFIARRFDGANREPFYLSDALYNINGYNRNLENKDLSEYIYNAQDENIVKPLTNQPTLTHTFGQTQYFNFILKDANRVGQHRTGIIYKFLTQSGNELGEEKVIYETKINNVFQKLNVVNTIKLEIDKYLTLEKYAKAGLVEIYLNKNGVVQSQPLTFRILPECLHTVKDFAFLNALGGWSTFNFEGEDKTDFKASANTIFKTQTPNHKISSDIESVYNKEVKEQFSVQTMPLDNDTINWLKEMSTSKAVYELATKRYIIVDEMNIKQDSKNELSRVEMKYRYSDSYNSNIN